MTTNTDIGEWHQEDILRFLLGFHPGQWPCSVREIAAGVGLAPSTVLKHLRALEAEGFVERGAGRKGFRARRVA